MMSTAASQAQRIDNWTVEALRGTAALMVVLAHYSPLLGEARSGVSILLTTGVDLFFVLSGFVFAPYFFGKRLDLLPHLIRRIFRIYPLYLLAVLCYSLLRWKRGDLNWSAVLLHLVFLHTWESRELAFHLNPAFWSLPPEVEFYLLLGILAALARTPARFASIALVALAVRLHVAHGLPANPREVNGFVLLAVHLPGLLSEFLVGSAVWLIARRVPTKSAVGLAFAGVGLAAWLALAGLLDAVGGDTGADTAAIGFLRGNIGLLAALCFGFILFGLQPVAGRAPGWLQRLALAMGGLSYGVYLFHNAMPRVLEAALPILGARCFAILCLALTLAVAQLLHTYLELPMRRLGRRLAAVRLPDSDDADAGRLRRG